MLKKLIFIGSPRSLEGIPRLERILFGSINGQIEIPKRRFENRDSEREKFSPHGFQRNQRSFHSGASITRGEIHNCCQTKDTNAAQNPISTVRRTLYFVSLA